MGRVSVGKGLGKDFCTLEKPSPMRGVKGTDEDKISFMYNIYLAKNNSFPSEIFIFGLHKGT
jgi:hypothetical protein